MKTRNCWTVLAKKAQDEVNERIQVAAEFRKRVDQLLQSRERMFNLLNDYKQKSEQKQLSFQSMAEATNTRQFILQMHELERRVTEDLELAQSRLADAQKRVLLAEQEKLKMQTLVEKDQAAVKNWEHKQEQKAMDALGVTLFNIKP
ncbi:MAG: flagellar FliJ family protein [Burkholderiaceae bacterium]